MKETYLEPAGRLEVYERCDILVVGSARRGTAPPWPLPGRGVKISC